MDIICGSLAPSIAIACPINRTESSTVLDRTVRLLGSMLPVLTMFCGAGAHRTFPHRQHSRILVAAQRFRDLYLQPCAFVAFAGYAPSVSPLHSSHRFRRQGGKSHFQPPIPLVRSNRQSTSFLPRHQLLPASAMATVDTVSQTRFWGSFNASTEDIQEGLSVGQATASDGHWIKWAYFCARLSLDPLLVAYKYPVPILNAFARDYSTGNIDPNRRAVRSRTVDDSVRLIGQAIAVLGAKDPQMTTTVNINGRL